MAVASGAKSWRNYGREEERGGRAGGGWDARRWDRFFAAKQVGSIDALLLTVTTIRKLASRHWK